MTSIKQPDDMMRKMFAVLTLSLLTFSLQAETPVVAHGLLKAKGNRIVDQHGHDVQLRGMSMFWSQWKGKYYTPQVVNWLVKDWKINVIRVAMAVDAGGYASNEKEKEKAFSMIDAAVNEGIYVIVDFHVHDAIKYQKEAVTFFTEVASRYGSLPNIIYEPWNEPVQHAWAEVIKPYHETVVAAIRKIDPDNLIVCGTKTWSQNVEEASLDPINDVNVAYTLHYYAATHKQKLREEAARALKNGIALMVTEYGTCESNGSGYLDLEETKKWWSFLDENKISHCNWSVSDKKETASILKTGISEFGNWNEEDLTPSGKLVREEIRLKNTQQMKTGEKGLKDFYADYFDIGVAVSPRALKTDEALLIKTNFNSLTAENAMKSETIHPQEKTYDWKQADSIVAFAQRNKMKLRGHTLVWHSQTPKWLFVDTEGKDVSKEILLERMRTHIHSVVSRYKGKIYAWDVVNEAVSDTKNEYLRKSKFLEIIGEEYIQRAFEFAHEADPDALLFYNDYNEIDSVKRSKIVKLMTSLRTKGVPVHGIGLQGHWAINEPGRLQLEQTLSDFSKTGLVLHVTELDISVYPKEHNARERKREDDDVLFTEQKRKQQDEVYEMCFALFRKYKANIRSVTFWNISDRHSWLDNFPVKGRKDYPLMFDQNLKPKSSYYRVTNF
jgi:endo-1,4-beta-xylanase